MILLFLGSWRSTVIIAISIPLAVLSALMALWATGQTLNIMTLGGLALAVGILVDDATVTIENINWHLEHGKDVNTAILDGARQIVQPAFVSLLCICIVFVPMFALKGVAGYLFVPMAMSVVFAMIASFILSRTLVPTMAMYLLKPHARGRPAPGRRQPCPGPDAAEVRARLQPMRGELSQPAGAGDGAPPPVRHRLSGAGAGVVPAGAVPGLELLSLRGCRPDHPACPPAGRHPHRGHAAGFRRASKTTSARSFRPANWTPSSTISACRTARST